MIGGIRDMDFITGEEKKELEKQLRDHIASRKELTTRIATARELGDLKENAEYHAAREDQGLNEAKIRELEDRLQNAQVADDADVPDDMVFLGATVILKDLEDEEEEQYRLVGNPTGDFTLDYIEVTPTSPMGMSLMKARVGETIRVDLPRGTRRYEIISIVD
ncbi:MAG: transcription elongation factor GreA [Phycisphaerae bacterium]|nr:transcription elongation factor GreA [Phycisphaerae bacterium]HAW96568.1 transcription elongation factor GreA [Phycisphaerales bacterium]|tara:strand:- start:360 stop:848 length:489 start_codon:yes stop_codon:yes gene_type:complete